MLEELDARIAAVLAADGRCSYTDLAERVGLSVSAVHQRVRRLEQRGVIRGYAAQIDSEQIGLPLTAFVSLTPIDPAAPDDYPQRLAVMPEIEACHSVAGVESYIVKVRVQSPAALESLLGQIRGTAGMTTRTTVVLSTPFEGRPVAPPTGVEVADPYRYLEDPDAARTRAFVDAQNALSRPYLEGLPAREPMLALTTALLTAPRRGVPWERGGRYFVVGNPGELDQDQLFCADGLD